MREIEKILLHLTQAIIDKFPDAETLTKPALTDKEIASLSAQIGADFPPEVVEYFKASLPVPCISELPYHSNETLGAAQFYFSFQDLCSSIKDMQSLAEDNHDCGAGEYIQPTFFDAKWLLIGYDDLLQSSIYIDLNPASKGTYGQIFQQDHLCDIRNVLATSIDGFFSAILEYFENLDMHALEDYFVASEGFFQDEDAYDDDIEEEDFDDELIDKLQEVAEIPFQFIDDTEPCEYEESTPLTQEEETKAIRDEFGLTLSEAEQFANLQEEIMLQNYNLNWQKFVSLSKTVFEHQLKVNHNQAIPLIQTEEEAVLACKPLGMLDFLCSQLQHTPKDLITPDITASVDEMITQCHLFFSPLRENEPEHQIYEYQVASVIIQYLSFHAYCGTLHDAQFNTEHVHPKFFTLIKKYLIMSPFSAQITQYILD